MTHSLTRHSLSVQSDPAKLERLEDPEAGRVYPSVDEPAEGGLEGDDGSSDGCLTRAIVGSRSALVGFYKNHTHSIWNLIKVLLFLAYNAYLVYAIVNTVQRGLGIDYCDGVGFLIIITVLAYAGVLYYYVLKPCLGEAVHQCFIGPAGNLGGKLWSYRYVI